MKFTFFCFFLTIAALGLFSLGRREDMSGLQDSPAANAETAEPGFESTIILKGRVQIYGNEPHTFAGIIDENGTEYAVYPPSIEAELRTLQGHMIEFTVVLLDEPQGFGSIFLKGGTITPVKWEIIEPVPKSDILDRP